MFTKYIGWDWRILPLIGSIGLFVSAAISWQYRWADALAFIGLFVLSVCWSLAVHDVWQNDCKELASFKKLKSQQEGREWEWLHPVIEWLDFNRKGLADDRIMVSYEIDSGLIDDFKPYRMWLKLKIGQYEPEDGYEIVPPHNLLAGRRSQGACIEVPITDKRLLERVDLCRKGKEISQTLRIVIQARPGDEKRYLEPEYSVNPYSDFIPEDEDTKL
jgi:hypothetical protein